MTELKIVAVIVVKAAYQEDLKPLFHTIVNETRKESGNISYELHQDIKNPLKYIMLEVWESQEAIDEHNASAHFNAFVAAAQDKLDSLTVDVIKKVY